MLKALERILSELKKLAELTEVGDVKPKVEAIEKLVNEADDVIEKDRKKAVEERDAAKDEKRKADEAVKRMEEERAREKTLIDNAAAVQQKNTALEQENSNLKTKAEAFEKYRAATVARAKEKMGDKWDDAYEQLPVESLEKLVEQLGKKPGSPPPPPGGDGDLPATWEEAMRSSAKMAALLKKPELKLKLWDAYREEKAKQGVVLPQAAPG